MIFRFYKIFNDEKIVHSLSTQLTWTHLKTLIYIEDELKRTFYIEMTKLEKEYIKLPLKNYLNNLCQNPFFG